MFSRKGVKFVGLSGFVVPVKQTTFEPIVSWNKSTLVTNLLDF